MSEWLTLRPRRTVRTSPAARSAEACSDADDGLVPARAASSRVPSGVRSACSTAVRVCPSRPARSLGWPASTAACADLAG
ncbi:MAG: hypothetical protein ABSB76_20790 [Streptosporangiaceae bacterium]